MDTGVAFPMLGCATPPPKEMNPLHVILAILLPPVAVALKFGMTKDFVINLVLTLLFFVPGVIHALYLVLKK